MIVESDGNRLVGGAACVEAFRFVVAACDPKHAKHRCNREARCTGFGRDAWPLRRRGSRFEDDFASHARRPRLIRRDEHDSVLPVCNIWIECERVVELPACFGLVQRHLMHGDGFAFGIDGRNKRCDFRSIYLLVKDHRDRGAW